MRACSAAALALRGTPFMAARRRQSGEDESKTLHIATTKEIWQQSFVVRAAAPPPHAPSVTRSPGKEGNHAKVQASRTWHAWKGKSACADAEISILMQRRQHKRSV